MINPESGFYSPRQLPLIFTGDFSFGRDNLARQRIFLSDGFSVTPATWEKKLSLNIGGNEELTLSGFIPTPVRGNLVNSPCDHEKIQILRA
jgi:hypothetical protein